MIQAAVTAPARVAHRLVGPAGAPVVVALGGISADRHVTTWWSSLFGPGKAVDTSRLRLLSFDFLGGNSPEAADWTGDVTTFDQAEALDDLLDSLEIERVHAFVGASYGGMVGLAFAERFAARLDRLVVISAAHKSTAMAVAWRTIQRQIVTSHQAHGRGAEGLALARALAMSTYRTAEEFEQRFSGPRRAGGDADAFPVWEYLKSRGAAYVERMQPEAFLRLSRSIDLHDIEPESIATPLTLVGVRQDQLVPFDSVTTLAQRVRGPCQLLALESIYGHDAFLKEEAFFSQLLSTI